LCRNRLEHVEGMAGARLGGIDYGLGL
jgi:hypothetical protein